MPCSTLTFLLCLLASPLSALAVISANDQVRHGAFHAACQALLYVLCYHMEPLLRPSRPRQHNNDQNGTLTNAAAPSGSGEPAAAAAAAAGGGAHSLGASGGTPASVDTPTGMRAHERRDTTHAQVPSPEM